MTSLDGLPDGWTVWNEEPEGRVVLAFRTDIFDGTSFPAECLPTITVAPGRSPDRPAGERERSGMWHIALYLEPAVRVRDEETAFADRDSALAGARDIATRFAAGEIDYRGAYQMPREAYLDALDDIVETP